MKKDKILLLLLLLGALVMGIGYATVNSITLSLSGTGASATNGTVRIISVTQSSATSDITASETHTDTSVQISASFNIVKNDPNPQNEHYVIYQVSILNDSIQAYKIGSELFNPQINTSAPNGESLDYSYEPIGITSGEEIGPKQTKTFTVRINLIPSGGAGTYSIGVNTTVDVVETHEGVLLGTLSGSTSGDLTSNTVTPFTVTVLNSHDEAKTFNFALSNSNFSVVDSNGNAYPNQTINAETENQNYTFYIKKNANVEFPNSPQPINVFLVPTSGSQFSVGVVSIAVPVNQNMLDNQDPVITSLTVTKGNTTRTLKVDWTATDNIGIDHYDVYLYDASAVKASQTGLTTNTYTFSNVGNGTYYVTLIAYDSRNSATSSTTSTPYTWTYNVTIECNSCTATPNGGQVEAGGTFSTSFSGNTTYTVNSVYMYDSTTGVRSEVTNYNYNSGRFSLSGVTGDVEMSVTGSCLARGTKIMLANGKYKNIEDIGYDDLLAVWNYDTGSITYEYPIWIEKEKETSMITRITFSDNTYIDIVNNHGLYDTDLNKVVDMYGKDHYKVGTNVAKINDDGTFTSVKITNIETIKKKTTFYFVASTRYYNIIANNILTTDHFTDISNLHGFNDNATWPSKTKDIVSNQDNLVKYDQFKDLLPYYLFKGFRVEEANILFSYNNYNLDIFANYIKDYITSDKYLKPPINKNNHNYWMVTTSLDRVNDYNKSNYLRKEGSIYKLPNTSNKWYSTGDNKYYMPGEYVRVNHGMHFIAVN